MPCLPWSSKTVPCPPFLSATVLSPYDPCLPLSVHWLLSTAASVSLNSMCTLQAVTFLLFVASGVLLVSVSPLNAFCWPPSESKFPCLSLYRLSLVSTLLSLVCYLLSPACFRQSTESFLLASVGRTPKCPFIVTSPTVLPITTPSCCSSCCTLPVAPCLLHVTTGFISDS